MPFLRTAVLGVLAATVLPLAGAPARAAIIDVTVTVTNLAPANSVAITPLRFGFNRGVFDAFNNGQAATAPIISIAEGGTGSAWFPAFAAADPTAVLGSAGGGAVLPGGSSAPATYRIDTSVNQFFTFGAMIVPSNDFFIGNDDPMAFRLFDNAGTLLISSISQSASDIWNAGSEAFDPANAAFLVGGDNDLRTPENGVVGFNFAELAGFNGRHHRRRLRLRQPAPRRAAARDHLVQRDRWCRPRCPSPRAWSAVRRQPSRPSACWPIATGPDRRPGR